MTLYNTLNIQPYASQDEIKRAYRKAIAEAREEIIIANAYFLPGMRFRRALRHAARRGVRVAPFKPQNMALNSAVTADGGEIGRAQALQALAAGLAPRIDFNPVLLKPTSDRRAQVIVHGHAVDTLDARDLSAGSPLARRLFS